jgi:hypothetical protein
MHGVSTNAIHMFSVLAIAPLCRCALYFVNLRSHYKVVLRKAIDGMSP